MYDYDLLGCLVQPRLGEAAVVPQNSSRGNRGLGISTALEVAQCGGAGHGDGAVVLWWGEPCAVLGMLKMKLEILRGIEESM